MIEETTRELIKLFRKYVEENTVLSAGSIVEIAKLPVIVLNGPTLTEKKRLMRDPERITVIDEEAGKAITSIFMAMGKSSADQHNFMYYFNQEEISAQVLELMR